MNTVGGERERERETVSECRRQEMVAPTLDLLADGCFFLDCSGSHAIGVSTVG